MRQNGHGTLTFEDARTWIEETGLCHFLPRRQSPSSVAPSFVEAVAGQRSATPDQKHIQLAEELLVRLELSDVAVRLNGIPLAADAADQLPNLAGIPASPGTVIFAPATITFLTISDAGNHHCQ